jgi:H+-translocating NAD(P) transhydrogenase subunit beta
MPTVHTISEFFVITVFLVGIYLFRSPTTARWGNSLAAAALLGAVAMVFATERLTNAPVLALVVALGAVGGLVVAVRVSMLGIPALVALQNGAGATAAFLVAVVELSRLMAFGPSVPKWGGLLALLIGAFAAAASVVAAGKLMGKLRGTPVVIAGHTLWVAGLAAAMLVVTVAVGMGGPALLPFGLTALVVLAMATGILLAVRVGGADMPVMISFLNAASGLAAASAGIVVGSRLLIVCGATVGASGTILTGVMCRAMNRSLLSILTGFAPQTRGAAPGAARASSEAPAGAPVGALAGAPGTAGPRVVATEGAAGAAPPVTSPAAAAIPPSERARAVLAAARRVVFVPGYGMALGGAQFEVMRLANLMEQRGVSVTFAIHPVAGRMPGHMNVLLAEADVSYDQLVELDDANESFGETDVVIVVGACDVVNPAAGETDGTPISGMPVLRVEEARQVIVCNLDERPGYSGVPNTLYDRPHVVLLFGQAKDTLQALSDGYRAAP